MGVPFHHEASSGLMRMRKVNFRNGLYCSSCGCLKSVSSTRKKKDSIQTSVPSGQQLRLNFTELQECVRLALTSYGVANNAARGKNCVNHKHVNGISLDSRDSTPIRFFQLSDLLKILNIDGHTEHIFHNSHLRLLRGISQIYSEPINFNSLSFYGGNSEFAFNASLRGRSLSQGTQSQLMYLESSHIFSQLKDYSHISNIEPEIPLEQWDFLDIALDTPSRMLVFDDSEIATQSIVYSDNLNLVAHHR